MNPHPHITANAQGALWETGLKYIEVALFPQDLVNFWNVSTVDCEVSNISSFKNRHIKEQCVYRKTRWLNCLNNLVKPEELMIRAEGLAQKS